MQAHCLEDTIIIFSIKSYIYASIFIIKFRLALLRSTFPDTVQVSLLLLLALTIYILLILPIYIILVLTIHYQYSLFTTSTHYPSITSTYQLYATSTHYPLLVFTSYMLLVLTVHYQQFSIGCCYCWGYWLSSQSLYFKEIKLNLLILKF